MTDRFTLGEHRSVLQELVTLMKRDITMWEPGLLLTAARHRSWRYRGALLGVGALRYLHLQRLGKQLEDDPTLVDDPFWVAKHVGVASAEFLIAPLVIEPGTYWRRTMSDAPFFMQTWLPIALIGAHRGPVAALVGGATYSPAIFITAALVNRDFRPNEALARRIGNYVGTGAVVGVFIATVVHALGQSSVAAKEAESAAAAVAEQRGTATARRTLRARLVGSDRAGGRMLELAIAKLTVEGSDDRATFDGYRQTLASLPVDGRELTGGLQSVVEAAAAYADVDVDVTKAVTRRLHTRELEFLHSFLEVTLDNVRRHAGQTDVPVDMSFSATGMIVTVRTPVEVDTRPTFTPGRGLANVRLHARALGGDVTVDHRTGAVQAKLPPPAKQLRSTPEDRL